jgi:hypothetical protein
MKRQMIFLIRIVFIIFIIVLSGCSHAPIGPTHQPGEKIVQSPEKTQEQYSCASHRRSVLQLEEVQLLPEEVLSGKEINQRIRYALCTFPRPEILRSIITRTIYFNRQEIFHDVTHHEFKPGTWIVDVFIGIPKEAYSGKYTFETLVKYKKTTIKDYKSFTVRNK